MPEIPDIVWKCTVDAGPEPTYEEKMRVPPWGFTEVLYIFQVFQKARATAPSILFIDEIDSLVGKRSESGQRGVQERVLSTLLNEMDGIGVRLDDNVGTTGSQKLLEGGTSKEEVGVYEK